jgi:phosphatidylglycerol---prolipoprotein diacylglyceryl transferase
MNFLPNPIAISIPLPFPIFGQNSLPIYWYGILIVVGAIAGAYLGTLEAKRRGLDPDHVWNALLFALVFGVIGARLYHIVSTLSDPNPAMQTLAQQYLSNPITMLNPRTGGLGIYGAVAGGLLGLWIYARYAHLKFWQWVDIAIPGLALGQAIGRWGNFFNQELYGFPTTLPWGIPIDQAHRLSAPGADFTDLSKYPVDTTRFHPTFLYESLAMLIAAGLLLYVARRYSSRLKMGDMLLIYGMLYPLVRFFTEMERPDAWKIADVPTAQIIAVASFVICGVWFAYRHTGPATSARQAQSPSRRRSRAASRQTRKAASESQPDVPAESNTEPKG